MRIAIAERLRPYAHIPGATCLLPGSTLCLEIFPALMRLYDLSACRPVLIGEVSFSLHGPVSGFTVIQDLEQCEVRVFGQAQEGYFRYCCRAIPGTKRMCLRVKKGNLPLQALPEAVTLEEGEPVLRARERLSLGSHKAQEWTLMQARQSLEELLPLWFCLGQLVPALPSNAEEGTARLLERCRQTIVERERDALAPAFLQLFLAGFKGMLVPRLEDDQFQGFALPPLSQGCSLSPLVLLTEGAALIRSLFVQQQESSIAFLPALPPQFHCGRMTGVRCLPFGTLDLEWTKKQVRRLIFHAEADGELRLMFARDLKQFRLRVGTTGEWLSCGAPMAIEKGRQYLLDHFQK